MRHVSTLLLVFIALFSVGCAAGMIPLPTVHVGADMRINGQSRGLSVFGARSHGRITNYTDACLEIVVDGKTVGGQARVEGEDGLRFIPALLPPGETFSVPLFYTGSRSKIVTVRGVTCNLNPNHRKLVGMDTHQFRIGRGSSYRDQQWSVTRLRPLTSY